MPRDEPGRAVLVASSSSLFAGAAAALLAARDGWQVTGVAHDGLQALATIQRRQPDAVLILRDLGRLGPAALAGQIRRRWPEITVVCLGDLEAPAARILPPAAPTEDVLEALAAPPETVEPAPAASGERLRRLQSLTRRERDVLRLLGSGSSMQETAERLGTSVHTIRTHMHNLYRKLDAHTRLDIVRFAAEHGLLEPDPEEGAGRDR